MISNISKSCAVRPKGKRRGNSIETVFPLQKKHIFSALSSCMILIQGQANCAPFTDTVHAGDIADKIGGAESPRHPAEFLSCVKSQGQIPFFCKSMETGFLFFPETACGKTPEVCRICCTAL